MPCDCNNFACLNAGDFICLQLTGHHPRCQRLSTEMLSNAVAPLLVGMVAGIESWAADEDGVPDALWPHYQKACRALCIPETKRAN